MSTSLTPTSQESLVRLVASECAARGDLYRPRAVEPLKWYPLLVFAHLSERRPDASDDEPDPIDEVANQASRILDKNLADYRDTSQESEQPIPIKGSITLVPEVKGIEFNPASRNFVWEEPVHREEFRMPPPVRWTAA